MLWQEVAQSGKINDIVSLMDLNSKGVSACMDYLDKWEYFIAVETDKEIPNGLEEYIIPSCTWQFFLDKVKCQMLFRILKKEP